VLESRDRARLRSGGHEFQSIPYNGLRVDTLPCAGAEGGERGS
jgi:hypothetical protein